MSAAPVARGLGGWIALVLAREELLVAGEADEDRHAVAGSETNG
jgi:hypothetical protein